MTSDTAQRSAPRATRFLEMMSPLVEKLQKGEEQPVTVEAKPDPPEQQTSGMALIAPSQTAGSSRQDEVVARKPEQAVKSPVIMIAVIKSPVKSPVKSPIKSPVKSPIKSPVKSPIKSPVKSPVNKPDSRTTAGSSKPIQGKRQVDSRPKIPSLTSTMNGDDLDISFGSLPLRPEMRPICTNRKGRKCAYVPKDERDQSHIYICEDCNDRPICQTCIQSTLANARDQHRPEHYLRQWEPKVSVQFEKFLWERRHGARLHFGPKELLGREWLYSDHSFAPSSTGNLTVRFSVYPEPGTYRLSVGVRTYVSSSAISKDTLGKSNHATVKAGMTWIGSLGVGARTVDRDAPTPSRPVNASLCRLPEKIVEVQITQGPQNEEQISPPGTIQVLDGQAVEVSIRHWHDKSVFRKRSPFKWWLDSIIVAPVVEKEQIRMEEGSASCQDEKSR